MQFPLDLDLAPFVVGPSSTSAQYRLYAVVNHSGTLSYGHYTAYCDLVQAGGFKHFLFSSLFGEDSHFD